MISRPRLVGLDAARGLALIGMMAVHILPSEDPDGTISVSHAIFSGRSAALFAVLAGVGLALANGRQTPPAATELRAAMVSTAARAALIAPIGFYLGELGSRVAVILVNYGWLFLVGSLFLGLRGKTLLWLAALWTIVGPILSHLLRQEMPAPSLDVPGFDSLLQPLDLLRELSFTGYYPVFNWMAYLWAGMGIGRLDLRKAAPWLAAIGSVLALGALGLSRLLLSLDGSDVVAELPIQFRGVTPTDSLWYLAVPTPHSSTPIDLAHTIGTALFVIGACLLLARLVGWLAGAGAMTLTLYTAHVAALATGIGSGLLLLVVHAALALAFGWWWKRNHDRGPLESITADVARAVRQFVQPSSSR